jgi:predicted Fe-S protein YdhL (DUF1289 family)
MAKDIENPCISVCQLNSELCVSCGRTKEDIRKWKRMKRPEKMAAVQRATLRLKSLQKRTLKPPSFTFSTVFSRDRCPDSGRQAEGNAIPNLSLSRSAAQCLSAC